MHTRASDLTHMRVVSSEHMLPKKNLMDFCLYKSNIVTGGLHVRDDNEIQKPRLKLFSLMYHLALVERPTHFKEHKVGQSQRSCRWWLLSLLTWGFLSKFERQPGHFHEGTLHEDGVEQREHHHQAQVPEERVYLQLAQVQLSSNRPTQPLTTV